MNNLFYPNMFKDFRVVVFAALLFSLCFFIFLKVFPGKYLIILFGIAGLVLIPTILKRPITGLYALPFIVYIIPEINITGVPMLSLGFIVCGITLFTVVPAMAFGQIHPKPSWLWLLVLTMFLIQFVYAVACDSCHTVGYLLAFVQGITPFLLFSLIVDKESDGRRVLLAWLIAFTAFGFFHMLYAVFSQPHLELVRALLSTREEHFGNYNPNTLGQIGLLYLPIACIMVGAANRTLEKLKWAMLVITLFLFLVFCFSRSTILGMVITFGLLIFFSTASNKKRLQLLLGSIVLILLLFVIWESVNWHGLLRFSSLKVEIGVRVSMISDGLKYVSLNPWFGNGPGLIVKTHSYFTKAAVEYGLIFFPIFCLPFIYIIVVSRKLSRYARIQQVRSLATGIFIAGVVAVPVSLFAITLKGAGYTQVFWLLIGYLHVANRELARSTQHEVMGQQRYSYDGTVQ